jgi:hypothetical protein
MARYVKKPIVIDADQWNPSDIYCVERALMIPGTSLCGDQLLIETLEGTMSASPGDWIIRGTSGEYYPCKDDIFRHIYSPFEENSSDEKSYIVTEEKLRNLISKYDQLTSCANVVNYMDDKKEYEKAYWDCRAVEYMEKPT